VRNRSRATPPRRRGCILTRPFTTVADLYRAWTEDVLSEHPPPTWSIGDPTFDHVEVAPGRVILLGGAPGAGKTALLLQWLFGILGSEPEARILVANVEMTPNQLLTRQLSRLSGVPLTDIRKRQVKPDDFVRLGEAMERIRTCGDRLGFASTPGDFNAVRAAAAAHRADVVCLDYIQRVVPPGKFNATRDRINALMSELRSLADGGAAIIAAAALTRSRDGKGRASYAGQHLSLASFRESSELEYGCDAAFLLTPTEDDDKRPVLPMLLKHEKNRDGETKDAALMFDRRIQRFDGDPFLVVASPSTARADQVRAVWGKAARNGKVEGPGDGVPH
jgi:replicative DNA helicase